MSNYITRPNGHDPTYQGPYTATGVSLRLYTLTAQYARLAATLDRYLNAMAGAGVYRPLGNKVIACFAAMDRVEGVNPQLGWMREIDVAFFIPTVRFDHLTPKFAMFAPYLFVDIPQAVASGREVHGYRKDFGTSFSTVDTYADTWTAHAKDLSHVEAWAIAAPATRLRRLRLIDVTHPAASSPPLTWNTPADAITEVFEYLIGDLADLALGLAPVFKLAAGALKGTLGALLFPDFAALFQGIDATMPIVFLRQFRNPGQTAQADVCQIVHANTRLPLAKVSGRKLVDPYALTFHDQASHPFSTELGVASGMPIASGLTLELDCDFVLEEAL